MSFSDFVNQYSDFVIRYNEEPEEADAEDPVVECDNCPEEVPQSTLVEAVTPSPSSHSTATNAVHICPTCAADEFTECDDCSTLTENSLIAENVRTRNRSRADHPVCQSCLDDNYGTCSDCDRLTHNDDMGGENTAGDAICSRCAEEYFTCEACDGRFHNDDYGEDSDCQDCVDAREEANKQQESDLIHPYSYKPKWIPHGEPRDRHYGVELETVSLAGDLDYTARLTLDKLNKGLPDESFAFLKEDGSLDDAGVGAFEIVTHPATLEIHRQRWPAVLGSKSPGGLVSHDAPVECGLHVHVDKKGLSEGTIGKMLHFVNNDTNREFMVALARRDSEWAKFDSKKTVTAGLSRKKTDSRREAVNVQNEDTLEFRIFKGTLKPESFFRSLEFCDALVNFTRNASYPQVVGVEPFAQFVETNRRSYPNLYPFVQKFLGRPVIEPKPRPEKLARSEPFQVKMSVRLKFD